MSKEKGIVVDGIIDKAMSNGSFKVILENGHEAMVHISGKIRINKIRITEGDSVCVELSPYDLSKGRIVYLYKPNRKSTN